MPTSIVFWLYNYVLGCILNQGSLSLISYQPSSYQCENRLEPGISDAAARRISGPGHKLHIPMANWSWLLPFSHLVQAQEVWDGTIFHCSAGKCIFVGPLNVLFGLLVSWQGGKTLSRPFLWEAICFPVICRRNQGTFVGAASQLLGELLSVSSECFRTSSNSQPFLCIKGFSGVMEIACVQVGRSSP